MMSSLRQRFTWTRLPWRSCSLMIPVLLAGFACDSPPTRPSATSPPVPSVRLSIEGPEKLTPGATAVFSAILVNTVDQSRRDVSQEALWTSSDPSVVMIVGRTAVGRGPGETILEARFGDWTATRVVSIDSIDSRSAGPPATLVIESLSVRVFGPSQTGRFNYQVRFRLRETGGESGAIVGDVVVTGPAGSDMTGPGCWQQPLRVPPGGTLDVFETDAGLAWLSYCGLFPGGWTATPILHLTVNFSDDYGRGGSVQASVGIH